VRRRSLSRISIVIGIWPYMHCRVTLAALDAVKHVLCEARLAMDTHEAHAMRKAAVRRAGRAVADDAGVDRTMKQLLADGFLGDLLAIEVRDGNAFLDRDTALHWRQDFDLSGFNVMWCIASTRCSTRKARPTLPLAVPDH
jgi:predicted dehydrogenase